jgi:hypothetical protein
MSERTLAPHVEQMPDIVWAGFTAWADHLHDADPLQLAHVAADVEYLPPSPVADRMRAEVDAEQQLRQPSVHETAGLIGWSATADRINRWSAAGGHGHWTDPEYDEHFDGGEGGDR